MQQEITPLVFPGYKHSLLHGLYRSGLMWPNPATQLQWQNTTQIHQHQLVTRYQHQQRWRAPATHHGSPEQLQRLKEAELHLNAIRSQLTAALQPLSQKTLLISCKHKAGTHHPCKTHFAFQHNPSYPSTLATHCQKTGQGERDRAARNQIQGWGYHHRLSTWENQAKDNP